MKIKFTIIWLYNFSFTAFICHIPSCSDTKLL